MHAQKLILLLSLFTLHYSLFSASPIRPLAQNHVVLDYSPDPKNIYCYNPTIIALPDGRLVAAYARSINNGVSDPRPGMNVFVSDDHGITWKNRGYISPGIGQSRFLYAGNALYLIGSSSLRITRSTNRGDTWSRPVDIRTGQSWHQSANNFIRVNGYIYTAIEYASNREILSWNVGDLAPFLLRAKETDNLANPNAWTLSSELSFKDVIPYYRDNVMPALNNSGIPFYVQTFPNSNSQSGRSFSPMGWLETNVTVITDPKHPWYDPAFKTFYLLMRANTGTSNIGAIAKVTEDATGNMTTSIPNSPAGIPQLFIPIPGGQMRFHILQDPQTNLYWLLSSQTTYSMTRGDKLPRLYYGLPENQRQRLVLHFSKDLIRWNFAGVVAIGESPNSSRHYAAMDIDGNDLVVLSRSGDPQAKSAHDGNLITFHRVKNFRNLTY